MKYLLKKVSGPGIPVTPQIELVEGGGGLMGNGDTNPECPLPIYGDQTVSRRHVQLRVVGGCLELIDQESFNGTWINGHRIQKATLRSGDRFIVGKTELVFSAEPIETVLKPVVRPVTPSLSPPGRRTADDRAAIVSFVPGMDSGLAHLDSRSDSRSDSRPVGGASHDLLHDAESSGFFPAPLTSPRARRDESKAETPEPISGQRQRSADAMAPRVTDTEFPALRTPQRPTPDEFVPPSANTPLRETLDAHPVHLTASASSKSSANRETASVAPKGPWQLADALKLRNGLFHYEGMFDVADDESPRPSQLLADAFGPTQWIAIVHLAKLGLSHLSKTEDPAAPSPFADCPPLFSWIPDLDSARAFGPILCVGQAAEQILPWVDSGWGQDGVLLFEVTDQSAALSHLLDLVHNPPLRKRSAGMFGYCWPSVLSTFLTEQPSEVAQRILGDHIRSIVMELPDLGTGWQVFGKQANPALDAVKASQV